MKKLILIGGGGHFKSCIDVVQLGGEYKICGILDTPEKIGTKVLGYSVIGSDEDITKLVNQDFYFLITIGQLSDANQRISLFDYLVASQAKLAKIISPRAYVSEYSVIGPGTIIMHDSLINAGASVGSNCIINSKALVEHDAVIEDHCHISTSAVINGGVNIKEGTFFVSNAVTKQGTSSKINDFVKAGSVMRGNTSE